MSAADTTCPHCHASVRPRGIEVSGVYDGVLYWTCPDCSLAWPRWTDVGNCLTALSRDYADRWNAQQDRAARA